METVLSVDMSMIVGFVVTEIDYRTCVVVVWKLEMELLSFFLLCGWQDR